MGKGQETQPLPSPGLPEDSGCDILLPTAMGEDSLQNGLPGPHGGQL